MPTPQDAAEYFQHLLTLMERAERTAGSRLGNMGTADATPDAFRFGVETRIQVQSCGDCTPDKGNIVVREVACSSAYLRAAVV